MKTTAGPVKPVPSVVNFPWNASVTSHVPRVTEVVSRLVKSCTSMLSSVPMSVVWKPMPPWLCSAVMVMCAGSPPEASRSVVPTAPAM
jgi:hypothetical protein